MTLSNNWLGYLARSYEQIKSSVLAKLTTANPELTDHSETNPLIIFISIFAAIAEVLNLYIDNMARESFIRTARKFSSMVELVRILDYRIKAANPSSAIVTLYFKDNSGNPVALGSNYIINAGFTVKNANNVLFKSLQNVTALIGSTQVNITVVQEVLVNNVTIGNTNGTTNQKIQIPGNYVDSSMSLLVDIIPFTEVKTFARSNAIDKHYIVDIDIDNNAYVVFGDGIKGAIPSNPRLVVASYQTTSSIDVPVGSLTIMVTALVIGGVSTITCNNLLASTGANTFETIDQVRVNAPLSIRTLNRAVTIQDFKDLALLCPGIGKVTVEFCCTGKFNIYIAPITKGIANSYILSVAEAYFDGKRLVGKKPTFRPAGLSSLVMVLNIIPVNRVDGLLAKADLLQAIVDRYDYSQTDINDRIRISDIVSLADDLPRISEVELITLAVRPYARPYKHQTELTWERETQIGSVDEIKWKIVYDNPNFRLFREDVFVGTLFLNVPYTDIDNIINLTVQLGVYTSGMTWEFKTYPLNKSIQFDDYSVPTVEDSDVLINILPIPSLNLPC